ncbi:ABC transporter ATP-binding protein [Amedibacillus sp. YH-ame10]
MKDKIYVKNLTKVYGKNDNKTIALHDVTFNIDKNEFVAICGSSGSGKTTLFNIISGIDRQYEGDCFIDEVNIKTLKNDELTTKRRKDIGVIYQFFNLISFLTVEENIKLSKELDGKKVDNKNLDFILKQLDLEKYKNSFIHELSGGQQQRVAIARVMLADCDIILADEPTGNLDSHNTINIMEIFKQMKSQGKTIVVITHDSYVANQADRIINLKDGEIVDEL